MLALLYIGGTVGFLIFAALLLTFFFPSKIYDVRGGSAAVTGASEGLGVFIAHRLAQEGAVAFADFEFVFEVCVRFRGYKAAISKGSRPFREAFAST
ncbi:unnamed protein product [Effrenium voratum]|nr:unnamed protein product [Effrenium voratum]